MEGFSLDILPDPWDKGTGRPKSLSLREAIMVTLLYQRQNMIEEVIADLFGVSQGTVSEIITEFTPLIAQATEEFRPDAEEAKHLLICQKGRALAVQRQRSLKRPARCRRSSRSVADG